MSTDGVTRRLRDALAHPTGEPLSARLVEHLWQEVVDDTLPSGARLPTVRELAVALSTSPRTVSRAYEELERLGVVEPRPGEGTFVSLAPPPEEEHRRQRALGDVARDAVERAGPRLHPRRPGRGGRRLAGHRTRTRSRSTFS
jgi:GntR family transcriptional regulator